MDYMIRATAAGAQLRAFAITSRDLVEEARATHNTSPIATAALGRLMSGALMVAGMSDNPGDVLTIRLDGDGPLGPVVATADGYGFVKGYVQNTDVILPPNAQHHLNVGGGVGKNGTLTVIRDMGLKDPYVGQIGLHSGEIADDLTYYFAESEQTPSTVGLGVLMSHDNTVRQAGGFIVQLLPFAEESVISHLEENLRSIDSVTQMLDAGLSPEQMLERILVGFDVQITEKKNVAFRCSCSRERMEKGLKLLGEKELGDILDEGKDIDLVCQFCGKHYTFTVDEVRVLRDQAKEERQSRQQKKDTEG